MSNPPPPQLFGSDAFAPRQVAERIDALGVAKARLPLGTMFMLSLLAGAFIGLGSMLFALVTSDASLSFAAARLLGGLVFSLGLLLVVVAGAELFTGNNLLAMAWADGRIGTAELLRNWLVVCSGNFVGALLLVLLVLGARFGDLNGGEVGRQLLRIAVAKAALPADVAFFRGVLCNVLVCLALWMAAAGRSVVDKAVAIVPPIAAFVAAGFEHSIANMVFLPYALLQRDWAPASVQAVAHAAELRWADLALNLGPVIAGNLVGGSVLVALVYWVIYRPGWRQPEPKA